MVIFLNGSVNAGKSTVAKLLKEKLPNSALVEVDVFHEMIEWMPIDRAVPLNLENAVTVIRNFSKNNLNVIATYPLSEKNYEYVMNNLKDLNTPIYFFTLSPKLEIALKNRGERKITEEEKTRINHHYKIGIPDPTFGEIIDNSDQTPEETTEFILTKIN